MRLRLTFEEATALYGAVINHEWLLKARFGRGTFRDMKEEWERQKLELRCICHLKKKLSRLLNPEYRGRHIPGGVAAHLGVRVKSVGKDVIRTLQLVDSMDRLEQLDIEA